MENTNNYIKSLVLRILSFTLVSIVFLAISFAIVFPLWWSATFVPKVLTYTVIAILLISMSTINIIKFCKLNKQQKKSTLIKFISNFLICLSVFFLISSILYGSLLLIFIFLAILILMIVLKIVIKNKLLSNEV